MQAFWTRDSGRADRCHSGPTPSHVESEESVATEGIGASIRLASRGRRNRHGCREPDKKKALPEERLRVSARGGRKRPEMPVNACWSPRFPGPGKKWNACIFPWVCG
jgi:hypothetical protein